MHDEVDGVDDDDDDDNDVDDEDVVGDIFYFDVIRAAQHTIRNQRLFCSTQEGLVFMF